MTEVTKTRSSEIVQNFIWPFLSTVLWFTILPVSRLTDSLHKKFPHLQYNLSIQQYYNLPLVGALTSLAATTLVVALHLLHLPTFAAAAIGAILIHIFNGGIHLEGYADTTDALYARESDRFKIMTDPHIGGLGSIHGAIALLTHTTITATAFYTALHTTGATQGLALILAPTIAAVIARVACFFILISFYGQHHPQHLEHLFPPHHPPEKLVSNISRFSFWYSLPLLLSTLLSVYLIATIGCALLSALIVVYRFLPRMIKFFGFVYGDMLGWSIIVIETIATLASVLLVLNLG